MTPTDADRQRAQRLYRELAQVWTGAEGVNAIAAAIAAARAEALEQAARIADELLADRYTVARNPMLVVAEIAAAIRALKEPGHE